MKDEFLKLLFSEFNITKNVNRNSRDNIYNITIKNEDAVNLASFVYSDKDTLFVNRKLLLSKDIISWKRSKISFNKKSFSDKEIEYIKSNSIEDCIKNLNRSEKSIRMKK